jgi:hypothetical protein
MYTRALLLARTATETESTARFERLGGAALSGSNPLVPATAPVIHRDSGCEAPQHRWLDTVAVTV